MILALAINDAMDLIDAYGSDDDLWPRAQRDALLELQRTDEDFDRYIQDVKRVDDMLANWDTADDGLDVGDDDWDDVDDVDDVDDEEDDTSDLPKSKGKSNAPQRDADEDDDADATAEPDEDTVIEINPDRLEDMDEMFSKAIQKAFSDADPSEFRVFTRDFDEMVEIEGVTDHTSLAGIDQAVAKSTGVLQKDLRRMIASRSQVKRTPGMRRGRLHGSNLHRILAGDDRVFTRREEAQSLDTAISLVIDCSGSMQGRELKLATEAAYALGSVLHRLGIQFECLGFTDAFSDPRTRNSSYKREVAEADKIAKIIRAHPISMPKFKTFDERWTQPVQRRFAHVFNQGGSRPGFNMGSTPEGCGMEFAARRLIGRKEVRKIMIVMTDGEPGSYVYNARDMNDHWAYKRQSADMVKAIEAAGVDLIGVGICHNGPAGYYTNSMVIESLEQMPAQLMGLLKKFVVGK